MKPIFSTFPIIRLLLACILLLAGCQPPMDSTSCSPYLTQAFFDTPDEMVQYFEEKENQPNLFLLKTAVSGQNLMNIRLTETDVYYRYTQDAPEQSGAKNTIWISWHLYGDGEEKLKRLMKEERGQIKQLPDPPGFYVSNCKSDDGQLLGKMLYWFYDKCLFQAFIPPELVDEALSELTSASPVIQRMGVKREGGVAVVIDFEKTERPSWAEVMYLEDGSLEACILDERERASYRLSQMLFSGDAVNVVPADGKASLEWADPALCKDTLLHPMLEQERKLLEPIYGLHHCLYWEYGEEASFLPEQGLTDLQIQMYLNLFSCQLEENPEWLSQTGTTEEGFRQYDGLEFLKLAQTHYPGLPDGSLNKLPALGTVKNELGYVHLWFDVQGGRVTVDPMGLGGVLVPPLVKSIRQQGDELEFTLAAVGRDEVFEKTFLCEKLEKGDGYAVKKVEIHRMGD